MASTRRFERFVIVFAIVMLTVAGFSGVSHGTGYIVGQHTMALEVIMPKDNAAFKVGEDVHVTVRSSGFSGVKVTVKNQATGAEEELKASLMKNEGTTPSAPRIWEVLWPTAGKKPGMYLFTMKGASGSTVTPTTKTVTISVIQPSGPAKITFKEPAGGRQVKAGETVTVAVTATGIHRMEFSVKNQQTGAEKIRPAAHLAASDEFRTSWSTEGQQKGNYQIIARGFGQDGKILAEESVTMTVTGGAPPLTSQAAAKPVVVPNLVGMSEYQAVVALDKAGLKINPAKYVSTSKQAYWGKVVEQSIKAGTQTADPVTITVGQK
jgi:hypothetical protein